MLTTHISHRRVCWHQLLLGHAAPEMGTAVLPPSPSPHRAAVTITNTSARRQPRSRAGQTLRRDTLALQPWRWLHPLTLLAGQPWSRRGAGTAAWLTRLETHRSGREAASTAGTGSRTGQLLPADAGARSGGEEGTGGARRGWNANGASPPGRSAAGAARSWRDARGRASPSAPLPPVLGAGRGTGRGEPQAATGCPHPTRSPVHALTRVSLEGRGSGGDTVRVGWALGVPSSRGHHHLPEPACPLQRHKPLLEQGEAAAQ